MNITAKLCYKEGQLLPFLYWQSSLGTAFDECEVSFDLTKHQVVRLEAGNLEILAQIQEGHKGGDLRSFFGTIESRDFVVIKRKKNWFSGFTGIVTFETTLKDCGKSFTNEVHQKDLFGSFIVSDILNLKLSQDSQENGYQYIVKGTCAEEYRDLGEVISCLLLHHNGYD